MRYQDPTKRRLIGAAVDIIDRRGMEQLTVRSLAAATYYSPSSISHHASPMGEFLSAVWADVHYHVSQQVIGRGVGTQDDWADVSADNWLQWAREHPRLADFYVRHLPQLESLDLDARSCGVTAETWDAGEGAIPDAWYSCVRRVQAALGLALDLDAPTARLLLARDLVETEQQWFRIVQVLVARDRSSRCPATTGGPS